MLNVEELAEKNLHWINESTKPSFNEEVLCNDGTGFFYPGMWDGSKWVAGDRTPVAKPVKWARG